MHLFILPKDLDNARHKRLRNLKNRFVVNGFMKFLVLSWIFFISGSAFSQLGEKDSLLARYQAVEKKELLISTTAKVDLLNELSRRYRFSYPDSLKFFADRALALSKENNYEKGVIESIVRQGDYFSDLGQDDLALAKYEEAELYVLKSKKPVHKIEFYKNISLQYFFQRQLRKCLETAYEGILVARIHKLPEHEETIRQNLGFIYLRNNLFDEAEEELIIADSLSKETGNQPKVYKTRTNLALNSVLKGNIDQAKKYVPENIEFFSRTKEVLWLSRNYRLKSQILLREGKLDSAIQANQRSDAELSKLKNPRDKIEILILFTDIYFEKQDFSTSKKYADSSISLSTTLKDSISLLSSFEKLKQIATSTANYDEAGKYSDLAFQIGKVLEKNTSENNLKLLRTKFELEYGLLEKEVENNQKLMWQRRITLLVIVLAAVLLIFLIIINKIGENRKAVHTKLEAVDQSKNRLFRIIGHDLKEPVGTLHELLELYDSKEVSEQDFSKLVPRLKQSVDQSSFTLNNLLFWAKSQMNGIQPSPKLVDIEATVNQILQQYDLSLIEKNIKVEYSIDNKLFAFVDPVHLNIIMRNIISNAIKFTPNKGKINLNATEKEGMIEVSICDTGIGMESKTIKSIQRQDEIGSTPGTLKEKGTGIGLKIVQKLIRINKGRIKIESRVDQGTCFQLMLPKK